MEAMQSSWLILKQSLFIDFINDSYISIYDTESKTTMLSKDITFIGIIRKFYVPENIGSIEFNSIIESEDFEKAKSQGYIYIVEAKKRPVNLLPILNLQSDLQKNGDLRQRMSLLGSKLALISGVKVELAPMITNKSMNRNVKERAHALRQYCIYTESSEKLQDIDSLCGILKQLFLTSISIVDLYCNKDYIIEENRLEGILQSIPSYIHINLHLMIEDYECAENLINTLISQNNNIQLRLYADRYSEKESIVRYISGQKMLYFFAYSNEDLCIAEHFCEKINICPVVLENNLDWIKTNISLSQKEISIGSYSFNHLFRNTKLNANFFGIVDINVDGNVTAHGSKNILGNLSDNQFSLIDVVNKELQNNDSWRKTRDTHAKCAACGFRYLCPPISIFELQSLIDTICR